MSDFTPGPWRAAEMWRPPISRLYTGETNADGHIFYGYAIHGCEVRGVEILPTLAAVHNFPNAVHANACLIAAAPDLLQAAKRALRVLKTMGESVREGNVFGALDAAIAKATGASASTGVRAGQLRERPQ